MTLLETTQHRLEKAHIPMDLLEKWNTLVTNLGGISSAVVAFSGGVDSSFLAYTAHLVMGDRITAVTIQSVVDPAGQMDQASTFAQEHHIPHVILSHNPLENPHFYKNPVDRCYYCKKDLLGIIWEYALANGFKAVLEGQNVDDGKEYRPGRKAVLETGTLSPLAQYGLTKADIRLLAKTLHLPVWTQPSSPCLATRFPYGTPITSKALKQVDAAETYLHNWGFREVRVRILGNNASIEVPQEQIMELMVMRLAVVEALKDIGFRTITVDLQGYRSGSLNEGIIQ
ncbi:MAG TPA: ATP-dependent sacrificial sulfur transferase LarE [Longilinea sp.]|nr:ATP-dependent sacrificial sulfur transferase LarE [Longilinea sp.]